MLFKTTAMHHISDRLVPEGTLVGDGTEFPISGPSMFMEPIDEEAKVAYEKNMAKWQGKNPPTEILSTPSSVPLGQRVPGSGPAPLKAGPPKLGPSGMQPTGTVKGD